MPEETVAMEKPIVIVLYPGQVWVICGVTMTVIEGQAIVEFTPPYREVSDE